MLHFDYIDGYIGRYYLKLDFKSAEAIKGIVMSCSQKENGSPANLMTDYMDNISGREAKTLEGEITSVKSLRCLIDEEFVKITIELKDFRKDMHYIDARLTIIETKLNIIEQNNLQMQKKIGAVRARVDKAE